MYCRGTRAGLTLIEVMIVITIIAVLFSIAIVGFVAIRRGSNEKASAASMKSLTTGEENFRVNDLDQNRQNDYWTGDLCGLYSIESVASGSRLGAISDVAMAGADTAPMAAGSYNNGVFTHGGLPITQSPKSGYWFQAMVRDVAGNTLAAITDTTGVACHSFSAYGYCAIPTNYGVTGTFCFVISEANSVFRRDLGALTPVVPSPAARVSVAELDQWPTSPELSANWNKVE